MSLKNQRVNTYSISNLKFNNIWSITHSNTKVNCTRLLGTTKLKFTILSVGQKRQANNVIIYLFK